MNLDGYALPIKKLKGTESVESLDLSGKGLRVASAIVIASLIRDNGSLTKILVGFNELREEGTTILCDALRESTVSKVEELNLHHAFGPSSAKISPSRISRSTPLSASNPPSYTFRASRISTMLIKSLLFAVMI